MELKLPKDFKEFFKSLNDNKVEYLLIGGYAVVVHGYVRNTSDIDLVVSRDPKNAERCVEALREFGFGGAELKTELFSTFEDSLVQLGFPPVKIEILNYLEGVDFIDAYERRTTTRIDDIEIPVIALNDLIRNKAAVGRLQDLLDIEKLSERNDKDIGETADKHND